MKSQVFTFIAAAVCSISGLGQVSAEITIEADMEIQGGIRDVMSAVMNTVGPAEKEALERGLEQLLAAADDDREFLMLQVIYWAAHTQEPDIRDYVMPFSAYVFEQLHLSDEEILEMALPYLTEETPYKVRYFTRGILGHIYTVYKDDGPTTFDFSFFANRIADQSEQNPEELYGLIDTIYEEDPGEVVLALMRAHGAAFGEIAAMEEAERGV
ncbi:MAG: hypothetical protein IID09_08800, partial [Candidatus Hydrogenedentes bacterium]|nr:hypothetical protein [Candidatus Hydrogenedentota bacterium]